MVVLSIKRNLKYCIIYVLKLSVYLILMDRFISCFSFNRIDIPPYENYEKFLDKLTCAVEETCGFAVE